jgi:hypothetical protein
MQNRLLDDDCAMRMARFLLHAEGRCSHWQLKDFTNRMALSENAVVACAGTSTFCTVKVRSYWPKTISISALKNSFP